MNPVHLTGLYIYPIKSAKGISLTSAAIADRGLQHDRRWMIVDEQNRFLTQRKLPRMALIAVELAADHLLVRAPGTEDLKVPLEPKKSLRAEPLRSETLRAERLDRARQGSGRSPQGEASGSKTQGEAQVVRAQVWDDVVEAVLVGKDADRWLTAFLGQPCRLVYMPDDAHRAVNPKYGSSRVSFADAFPLLLISEESLQDLNRRLERPVSMNRFRPNLVVSGCRPYEEDEWQEIRIGSVALRIAKPCARCTVPTVDQTTGIQEKEPIRTLKTYRMKDGKVLFGQNVIHLSQGTLSVGDEIVVTRRV